MLPYFQLFWALWIVVIDNVVCFVANILYVSSEWRWGRKYITLYDEIAKQDAIEKILDANKDISQTVSLNNHTPSEDRQTMMSEEGTGDTWQELELNNPDATERGANKCCRGIAKFVKGLWHDLKMLPFIYWMVVAMIFCLSPILYTFTAFGPSYFEDKWDLSEVEAGNITSVLYATILLAPVAGFLMDRFGYRSVGTLL